MSFPDPPLAATPTTALVALDPPDPPVPLDLRVVFGNDNPVELEVGVGKGRFVLLAAAARPGINFLGLEYARRYYTRAVERVGKRGLTNVRLVLGEASAFVAARLADGSLAGCHVYFPDPWPKKRHHKRRFLRPDNLDQLARVLQAGALLRVVTDHPGYAEAIREVLAVRPDFAEAAADPALWELPGMGDYTRLGITNFEIKYRREGRPFHRFAYVRRDARG
ncbi:MAG: tRNA (guanosine(46)-N7)-methyltransferase TrmB [Acidobacteria bacterium]|nr:tRNA (guanosine(46)-N7)-methyltransferase TrmB [Acidobacteriota bacterium]